MEAVCLLLRLVITPLLQQLSSHQADGERERDKGVGEADGKSEDQSSICKLTAEAGSWTKPLRSDDSGSSSDTRVTSRDPNQNHWQQDW